MVKRKSVNKLIVLCLVFVLVIGNTSISKAQEEQCAMEEMVLQEYKNVLLARDAESLEELFVDSEKKDLFIHFLEWRLAIMDILDVAYSTYEYDITDVTVTENGESQIISVRFNETHQYSNGAGNGASYGLIMHIEAETSSNGVKLQDLSFENDDFYDYFMEQMIMPVTYDDRAEDAIRGQTDKLIGELYDLKEEMNSVYLEQVGKQRELVNAEEISPYATSCIYSGLMGANYAKKYASQGNSYFYRASGGDCTNFVSQCIWAAYGGWSANMSDATMSSNITNKVRMTSTWYAGSGGGAPAWENVDHLWDYVVGNSGNGPKARGYNDGGHYTNILPIDIAVGDVLQKSSDGSNYTHSMYVVDTPGGSDPEYGQIIIAQHSGDGIKTLTEAFLADGKYYRQMHFITNNFDK